MKLSCERLLHRSATLSVLAVMGGLATWLHVRVGETREVLARRQCQVHAVHELHRACELGLRPDKGQLEAAAVLFPGMQLRCAAIGDALYLTFATHGSGANRNVLSMNVR